MKKITAINKALSTSNGLIISNTKTIKSFLKSASDDPHLPDHLRNTVVSLSSNLLCLTSLWDPPDSPPIPPPGLSLPLSRFKIYLHQPKTSRKQYKLKNKVARN
ncbi:hypothetical protein Ancab_014804 [Ancistrocladus abbreviatus]